jgi:hypothetical protein
MRYCSLSTTRARPSRAACPPCLPCLSLWQGAPPSLPGPVPSKRGGALGLLERQVDYLSVLRDCIVRGGAGDTVSCPPDPVHPPHTHTMVVHLLDGSCVPAAQVNTAAAPAAVPVPGARGAALARPCAPRSFARRVPRRAPQCMWAPLAAPPLPHPPPLRPTGVLPCSPHELPRPPLPAPPPASSPSTTPHTPVLCSPPLLPRRRQP